MKGLRTSFQVALSLGVLGALIFAFPAPRYVRHLDREAHRLRAHFDSVAIELRGRNVSTLTPLQRTARAELIAWLAEYRDAGSFPFNDGFGSRAVPIFRDHRGVLCAMAYLIDRSGRRDMVDRIERSNNLALIADLAGDAGLNAWLDSTGLSLAEAARIQPTYGPPPGTVYKENAISPGYAITSILLSGTALTSAVLNIEHSNKGRGWFGLVAGTAAAVTGIAHLGPSNFLESDNSDKAKVAVVDLAIGATAVVLGVRSLVRAGKPTSAGQLRVSPLVLRNDRTPTFGLALHARL